MLTGTAVYGTVRTVVWEDGGETRLLPDVRLVWRVARKGHMINCGG